MVDQRLQRVAVAGEAVVAAVQIYCHARDRQEACLKHQRLDRENEQEAAIFLRNNRARRGHMKLMFKEWKAVVLIIVSQAVLVFGESSVSAQQDTVPLTTDLDPSDIRLVVNSSPEYRKSFSDLAVAALTRAGIDIAVEGNKHSARKSDELILTVKPESLNDMCPGKVLYERNMGVSS